MFTVQKALPLFQAAGSIILAASEDLIAATLDSKCYVRLETLGTILATKGKIKADNPGNFFEHCRNRSCLNNVLKIHTYIRTATSKEKRAHIIIRARPREEEERYQRTVFKNFHFSFRALYVEESLPFMTYIYIKCLLMEIFLCLLITCASIYDADTCHLRPVIR